MRGSGFSSPPSSATGVDNLATGQVDIPTTAGGTLVAAARSGRRYIEIQNLGPNPIALGNTGLTFGDGKVLWPDETIKIETAAAVYAIASGGTSPVSYVETY